MMPPRILIVEDEVIVAMDIERRLSALGYAPVGPASTGAEALVKIEELRPDLVLMDIALSGGMDGVQVAEALDRQSGPPVVFLTAFSEDTTIRRARMSNVFGYIIKPFDERELKTVIEMALYKHSAEKAMRNSSQFYQQIIASAWEGILVCDPNLVCQVWNPAMEALTGVAADAVTGKVPSDVLPFLRDAGVMEHMRAVLAGKMLPAVEFSFQIPETGRYGWISHVSAPLRDVSGNLVGVVVMVRDISHRMKAEKQAETSTQQLWQSEERYRRVVEFCPDAVLIHCDGKIEYVNPAGLKLFGADAPSQIVGLQMLDLLHPDSRDLVRERIRLLRDEGLGSVPTVEEKFIRLDGVTIEVDVSGTALPLGDKTAIMVMARDISSRKMMEARFLRDQRIETIGALASGIAHDLNNVLSPITMTVALLRDKCEDPDTLALIRAMEVSAHRGTGVIQQLLTFGRGATGQHLLNHPKHLLKELTDLSRETFPKSIVVKSECRALDWLVLGDATQLHQVLLNLCINARDAMPQGGQLTLYLDFVQVLAQHSFRNPEAKPGSYVVFGVQDTGKGIPAAIQSKIFEPFFTTKEVGKGTGLGLATCLNLVKKHNGFIEWESKEGQGSLFKVYLPAVPAASAADISFTENQPAPFGSGELILVVDDEESIRKIIRLSLEKNGYKVLTANDGAEAVNIYREKAKQIHAVLIDVMMPVMGGPAAMRKMREINPDVLLIATSGMIPKDLEGDLAESRPQRFIAKPFTSGQLLELIAAVLAEG